MIVCHCKAVSDRAIRDAVRGGARTPRQVSRACQAGRICGGCRPVIVELIESEPADEGCLAYDLAPAVAAS